MRMTKLRKPVPAAEQETIISWMRGDEHVLVYTCDSTLITKLAKLQATYPDAYQIRDIYPDGVRYRVPVKLIRFAKPASPAMQAKGRMLASIRKKAKEKDHHE